MHVLGCQSNTRTIAVRNTTTGKLIKSRILCYDIVAVEYYVIILLQCLPFWPRSTGKQKKMSIGLTDSLGYPVSSDPFLFDNIHCTLLKLGVHDSSSSQVNYHCYTVILL